MKKEVEKNKNNKTKEKIKVKKDRKDIKFVVMSVILIILFSVALCPIEFQNDTYYTIKIGEHITENGIDMQDPFSWHENLPYTYPHWLYDLMIFKIYSIGGFLGIAISTAVFASILGITLFFVNRKISKNNFLSFLITIGAMYLLKDFIAARAQLVTFILFTFEILFIEKFIEGKKRILYSILLFAIATLIANLHSAVWPFFFILFMPYIAEYLIYKIVDANIIYNLKKFYNKFKLNKKENKLSKKKDIKKEKLEKIKLKISKYKDKLKDIESKNAKAEKLRKLKREKPYRIDFYKNENVKWLVVIMLICILSGLIPPIGDTPYTYLYKTMQGTTTQNINEHLPLTIINHIKMLSVLIGIMLLFLFTDTKMRAKDFFMLFGLGLLMFKTRRQESMFVIFGSGLLCKFLNDLYEKYDKGGTKKYADLMVTILGSIATILVVILISILVAKPKINNRFVGDAYPVKASEYLIENVDFSRMKLYNEYNYGSYLLFKGVPVFIDSRADLYAPEFNNYKDIFSDYINTSNIGKYYEDTFREYGITHVICYKNAKLNLFLSRDKNYKQLYIGIEDNFVIYERLNSVYSKTN